MILGSINQVHESVTIVVPSEDGHRGQATSLGVGVQALDGQRFVVVVGAHVALHRGAVGTGVISQDT